MLSDSRQKILEQEFPLVPSRYIALALRTNSNFLSTCYGFLAGAEWNYNSGAEYKRLLSARKTTDINVLKTSHYWTEMAEELEYARAKARKQQSMRLSQTFKLSQRLTEQ